MTGQTQVGGLVGTNGASVMDCYVRGAVTGGQGIGGLVGQNNGQVSRCYSAGPVAGLSGVGGLIGGVEVAPASTLKSFWDMETAGIPVSAAGTGATHRQMQDINTFLGAGWDLVGETANGTQDLWVMPADSYPELTMVLKVPLPPATRS